jgi:hypothetical protein
MGCGASSAAGDNDAAPKRWRDREQRAKRHEARSGGVTTEGSMTTLDTSTLSTGLLDDLRQKQRIETASINPVKRWIEGIARPSDQDNADLYDPVRRHKLSMDSVAQKKRRSGPSHQSPTRDSSDATTRPSEQQMSEGAGPTEQVGDHRTDDTPDASRSDAPEHSSEEPPHRVATQE